MGKPATRSNCPCGSCKPFSVCCAPLLDGTAKAQTAEQLMRSRYCAYAIGDRGYLLASWHPRTRPKDLNLDTEPATQWIGLKILSTEAGGPQDDSGQVEFIARYKVNGRAGRLRETSRFVREQDSWFYLDAAPDQ